MRTSTPDVLPLFRSEMQLRLLGLLLLQPERQWTMLELAGTLDAPVSSIHRELGRIEGAGVLVRDNSSKPHRFLAARESPLFKPLCELLARTTSVEDDLKQALEVPGVLAAAIHGSWAAGKRRPDSDIDVVVIGDADLQMLRRRTRDVGRRAGRRVDLTLFGYDEYEALVREGRGFVQHLLAGPRRPLVGDLHALVKQ